MTEQKNNMLGSLASVILGVLLLIFRSGALNWILTAAGVLLIVWGIVRLTNNDMASGIPAVIIGLLLAFGGWFFVKVALAILGLLLIIRGGQNLAGRTEQGFDLSMLNPILTIVVGVGLMISPWKMLDWVFVVIGIVLLVRGVLGFVQEAR